MDCVRYYPRKSFKQIVIVIKREDKLTVRDFLKKFYIIDTMDKRVESWDEVKSPIWNSAWKNRWSDCNHDVN